MTLWYKILTGYISFRPGIYGKHLLFVTGQTKVMHFEIILKDREHTYNLKSQDKVATKISAIQNIN